MINSHGASLLAVIGALTITPQVASAKKMLAPTPTRPNVILINIDDLGYGDPSCNGGTLYQTPNIDRLAAEGIRCTDGYVSAPVSGPSRTGLLTGSYQQRYGVQWNHDMLGGVIPGLESGRLTLPEEQRQIQSAFKEGGYVTGMAGKIGIMNPQPFVHIYSVTKWGCSYFPDASGRYSGVDVIQGEPRAESYPDMYWGPEREGDEYLTDRCSRQCIEFIEENKDNPFFFYLAYNAPHTPLQAKAVDKPRVAHIESEVAQLFAAMVLSVDDGIGQIVDYLDREGLRENTIIVVLGDNGPANMAHLVLQPWWPEDQPYHLLGQRGGLNGFKGNMFEAGFRVPYIISWPGNFESGMTYTQPVSTLDIYPTLCSAAHVRIPSNTIIDGVDLMPYFSGTSDVAPHRHLFWYANRMGAVRSGQWKFLVEDDTYYLFDLENDRGEQTNVMKENPEVTQELLAAYIEFRNSLPPFLNPFLRPIDIPHPDVIGIPVIDAY